MFPTCWKEKTSSLYTLLQMMYLLNPAILRHIQVLKTHLDMWILERGFLSRTKAAIKIRMTKKAIDNAAFSKLT
jgi:hypothetical protein